MQGSKIKLSPAEASLICNAEVILTKNRVIEKTIALLAGVQQELLLPQSHHFASSAKISKGENYLGLPYVVLDYPRISNEQGLCFIRSMMWWGKFFSSTLQLSGAYKMDSQDNIISAYELLRNNQYYVGISSDPWQHHFEPSNYTPVNSLSKEEFSALLYKQPHIKIAAHWPLTDWDAATTYFTERWKLLASLVS